MADTSATNDSISTVVKDTVLQKVTDQAADTAVTFIEKLQGTLERGVIKAVEHIAEILTIGIVILLLYGVIRLSLGPEWWEKLRDFIRKINLFASKEPSPKKTKKAELYSDDPFREPPKLFGREEDLERLKELLESRKPPVVQLIGKSGVGKTVLAAAAIRDLGLDYVRLELRSNSLDLRDVSAEAVAIRLLEVFTKQPAPMKSHAEIVALAMEAWLERGCLLAIDNLHCLLDEDTQPKDSQSKLLLEKLAEVPGEQLLTLSWPGTDALGMGSEQVLTWELGGLKAKPGVEKLRAEGIKGKPKTISLEKVVKNLIGNPKMLESLGSLLRENDIEVGRLFWMNAMVGLNTAWDH